MSESGYQENSSECKRGLKKDIVFIQCLSEPPGHSATQLTIQGKGKVSAPELFLKEMLP